MQNIKVTRYSNPAAVGCAGYIEPADGTWIAFVGLDGAPRFFLNRDAATGAVLPDDPAARDAATAAVREEQKRRAAWTGPVEGVHYPVFAGEAFCGHPQPPAGPSSVDGVLAGR